MQSSVTFRIRFRPVRIGWCIRNDNWDDFRLAVRTNQLLWGGKFNPIIPVESPNADKLVSRFRVDVLLGPTEDEKTKAFIHRFNHLPWPLFEQSLFTTSSDGLVPNFLDVSHPLAKIADDVRMHGGSDSIDDGFVGSPESKRYALVRWQDEDPLADVFLATFGTYTKSLPGDGYGRMFEENVRPFQYRILSDDVIPAFTLRHLFVCDITATDLNWDRIPSDEKMGFYVGQANNFVDLVNYWNLRACDLDVLFLDPSYSKRLVLLKEEHSEFVRQRRTAVGRLESVIPIWSRAQELVTQLAFAPDLVPYYTHVNETDVIQGSLRPPLHYWTHKSVLASIGDQDGTIAAFLQLPEKPFKVNADWSTECFVVSIDTPSEDPESESTFWTPYVPELNQWYGRKTRFDSRIARVEVGGIGFVTNVTDENITLYAIPKHELAAQLFEMAGIKAQPSLPGRIASRLIKQLGGLLGCKVLKISGVRALIKKYGPLDEFDRTEALRVIGNSDPTTGQPRFSQFEELSFEFRPVSTPKLKPENAFLFLLDKGVFRVGLTLHCPVCELSFWMHLDDLHTEVRCELCGAVFNVVRQLKDRPWTYKRSGLFGRSDNQQGSIPVALTLQQLQAHIHRSFSKSLFLTNLNLSSISAKIQPCETDLFSATSGTQKVQILIGECKDSGGAITLDDVQKMAAVADSFPPSRFDVYIIFSKTAPFTEEEILNCRAAQHKGGGVRVILFSDRELEPRTVYERVSEEFDVRSSVHSLHDMARITNTIYFSKSSKQQKKGPA